MPAYKNPGKIEFDGIIKRSDGGGAFFDFPYSVEELFGVKGRVPITATFDGVAYRGSMVKMGGDCHMILILKEIRVKLGKDRGDSVHVTVELDDKPRQVELAEDEQAALTASPAAQAKWAKTPFSHQREYHLWIEGAKQAETRQRRIKQMIERLIG